MLFLFCITASCTCIEASIMLYPCMICVSLSMNLFDLCVACLTVFLNRLVKPFSICVGVVVI